MDLVIVFNNSLSIVSFTFSVCGQFPKVREAYEEKQPCAYKIMKVGAGSFEV